MKKYIISSLVALALVMSVGTLARAEGNVTIAELQAQINQLMVLLQKLTSQQGTTNTTAPATSTVVPGVLQCLTYSRDLSVGFSGDDVKTLQQILSNKGFLVLSETNGKPTGYFGPLTKESLKKWQISQGLIASGKFDPDTRNKMNGVAGCGIPTSMSAPSITNVSGNEIRNVVLANGQSLIEGKNFMCKGAVDVYIYGIKANITQCEENLLYFKLPAGLVDGSSYDLYVKTEKGTSNTVKVKVVGVAAVKPQVIPVINSVSQSSGPIGSTIQVKGTGFTSFDGQRRIILRFGLGVSAFVYSDPISSNDNLITFKLADKYCGSDSVLAGVPCPQYKNITSGSYSLRAITYSKLQDGSSLSNVSNEIPFTVTTDISPQVTSLSKAGVKTGESVTITGTNFKTNEDNHIFIENKNGGVWQVEGRAVGAGERQTLTFTVGDWNTDYYNVYVVNSNGTSNSIPLSIYRVAASYTVSTPSSSTGTMLEIPLNTYFKKTTVVTGKSAQVFYDDLGSGLPIPEVTMLDRTSATAGQTIQITGKNFKKDEDNAVFIDNLKGSTWQVNVRAIDNVNGVQFLRFTVGNWDSNQYYVYVVNGNGKSNYRGLKIIKTENTSTSNVYDSIKDQLQKIKEALGQM